MADDPRLEQAIQLDLAGELERACELYRQVIDSGSPRADVFGRLGSALGKLGQLPAAIEFCAQAVRLDANSAEWHCNLGALLANAGRLDEADRCYADAVRVDPRYAQSHYNRGNLFELRGQPERAIASYRQALALEPDFAEALCNLGIVLCNARQFDEARHWLERADRLRPDWPLVLTNLGRVLQGLGHFEEAHRYLARATELDPLDPTAHLNLGIMLNELNRPAMAIGAFDRALELRPDDDEARFGRATALLTLGDFQHGWAEYESRATLDFVDMPRHLQPRWDGSPLEGRTLLLQSEQGLGDTLQFIRYLPLVRQRAAKVVVAVQPTLIPLLRSSGVENLVTADAPLPRFDVYAPLMSLPHIFGTTLDTIPHDVPYLAVEERRIERWREHLRGYDGFKIGIVWQGSSTAQSDPHRAIPLAAFGSLSHVPGVRLFSLQKGPGQEQLAALAAGRQSPGYFEVVELGPLLDNEGPLFQDTGAAMKCMDLVITSDTGAAHLAGGLAVPIWLALRAGCEWRWMIDRDDSPWYPTMRLFRQRTAGDWGEVFDRMAAELRKSAPARPTESPG